MSRWAPYLHFFWNSTFQNSNDHCNNANNCSANFMFLQPVDKLFCLGICTQAQLHSIAEDKCSTQMIRRHRLCKVSPRIGGVGLLMLVVTSPLYLRTLADKKLQIICARSKESLHREALWFFPPSQPCHIFCGRDNLWSERFRARRPGKKRSYLLQP